MATKTHRIEGIGTINANGGVSLSSKAAKAAGYRNAQGVDYPRNFEVRTAQRKAIARMARELKIPGPLEVFDGDTQVDEIGDV